MLGVHKFLQNIWGLVKRAPFTTVLTLIISAIGFVVYTTYSRADITALISTIGFGLPAFQAGEWWTVLTGMFLAPELWMYVTILPPLIFGAGYIEIRYGAFKMLATVIGTQIVSVILIAGLLAIGAAAGWQWAQALSTVRDVGLSNGAFGAVGVATAAFGVYWRFRIRLFTVLYCSVMVLYSAEVWDFTHLAALLVGFAIGPWVIGRKYYRPKYILTNVNARALAASLLIFSILSEVMTKIHPGNGGLLYFGNTQPNTEPFLAMLILVFVALWFSYGLYHGRRIAWWFVTGISSLLLIAAYVEFAGASTIANGFDVFYYAILLAVLLIFRKSFSAHTNRATAKRLLFSTLIAALLLALLHIVILYSIRHQFDPVPGLGSVAIESVVQIFGISYGDFTPRTGFAHYALETINDAWLAFILVAIIILLVSTSRKKGEQEISRYEKLLKAWGGSTLSWMGTWKDLQYFTNSAKTAILAYHLSGNVAIVLADPIGDKRTVAKLTKSFSAYCHDNGWTVAYFSTSEWVMKLLQKQSYNAVHIAQDTIVPLKDLEFAGKSWQSIRSSLNKAEKLGVSMQSVRLEDTGSEIHLQLEAIQKSWVSDKALPEMGFTLGTLREAADPEVRMNIAVDAVGEVHGMTSWLPVYGKNGVIKGWTLDIMQRKLTDTAMPGVIEFLIASSALLFKQEGYSFLSLSGAPLTGIENSDNLVERVMHWASVKFEPYYGFSSLHKFKEKFHPVYEPLYLVYKDPDQLPSIGIAIGKAYMNDANLLATGLDLLKESLPHKKK